jgi:hypothetical protein
MKTFKSKVKNLFSKGKQMISKAEFKLAAALTSIAGTCGIALCDGAAAGSGTDVNPLETSANKVLNLFFGLIKFAGIAMVVVGFVQFVMWALAAKEGQAQPGQMAKALGMFFGGLVCCLIEALLKTLGVPTTITF